MIFASYDLFFVCPPERKSVGFHFLRVKFCGQRSVPGMWQVGIFLVVWMWDLHLAGTSPLPMSWSRAVLTGSASRLETPMRVLSNGHWRICSESRQVLHTV